MLMEKTLVGYFCPEIIERVIKACAFRCGYYDCKSDTMEFSCWFGKDDETVYFYPYAIPDGTETVRYSASVRCLPHGFDEFLTPDEDFVDFEESNSFKYGCRDLYSQIMHAVWDSQCEAEEE